MAEFVSNLLDLRTSRGIVKDYQITPNLIQTPVNSYEILRDMFKFDPILSTALDLTVDLATYNGYDFIGDDKNKIKSAFEFFDDTLDFDQVLDNVLYQLLGYGDAYLELRKEKAKITELWPLETTEVSIKYDKHGRIIAYLQRPSGVFGTDGKQLLVPFAPEEIIHFRLKWIGSQVYSFSPFDSIARAYSTRVYANHYVQTIFTNMPPRILYALENANETSRRLFFENLRQAKSNPNMDLVGLGKVTGEKLQINFDEGLTSVLKYLRQEVVMPLRIPPHWLGLVEGLNRGIGESVTIPYETRIKKIQQKVASQINKELMEKLGFKDLTFKFNAISLADEKTIIANASVLKTLGLTSQNENGENPIIYYLRQKGIKLPQEVKIEEALQSYNMDDAPSRQRMDKKTDKMTINLDKKGVSEEGKEKLDQKIQTRTPKYWEFDAITN